MPQYIGRRLIIPRPPQTGGAIGGPGPRRAAYGSGRTTASRCGTAQGFRGGYGHFEFKDLKLKTKYKVLIPDENFVRSKSGNTRVSTYYDITRFCKPQGSSRILNNFTRLSSFSSARRTYTNVAFGYSWGGTDFISDSQGELSLSIFWHAFWRRSGWNRSSLYTHNSQVLTEEVRSTIIILPVSELTSAGNGLYTVNATNAVNPNPNPITLQPETPGKTLQDISFDFIQTFDLDVNKLDNVEEVDITDISLFFKLKPRPRSNSSGIENPGVSVYLVDVEKGQPQVDTHYIKSAVKIPYNNITASSDASVDTKFSFADPITLRTGRQYGIAIDFEDRGYLLWDCKVGHRKRGTNSVSPGPKKEYRGGLFERSNSRRLFNNTSSQEYFKQLTTTELKFAVSVAEYDVATDMTLIINNNNDEIIALDTVSAPTTGAADGGSKFFVGETVYVAASAQTASDGVTLATVSVTAGQSQITGTNGTQFTALLQDEVIILVDATNPEKKEEVKIALVYSDTAAVLKEPVMETIAGSYIRTMTGEVTNYSSSNKFLYLSDSTANGTNYILDNAPDDDGLGTRAGSTLIGVESGVSANVATLMDVPVSAFSADMDIVLPANYVIKGTYSFANNTSEMSPPVELNMDATNMIANNTAFVLSRSSEFAEASGPFSNTAGGGTKSANIALTIQYTGPQDLLSFESPTINIEDINIATTQWMINNDTTDEHTQYGNTESKHISKTLTFGEGNSAEDIRVIYNAYRPAGTDVQCFAKIINSEDPDAFDEKSWTKLELKSASEFSQTNQYFDFREFEFGFPSFPPTASTLAGTVTTTLNSAVVNGAGTNFDPDLVVGDVIRIYSPLFPTENYGIFSVSSVTDDILIGLSSNVANNNIVGAGLKIDKLTTPRTGFNNKENLNIVRYFGSDGEIYDTYSAVAIKTVLLSNSDTTVPKVDDYRVIGVSA